MDAGGALLDWEVGGYLPHPFRDGYLDTPLTRGNYSLMAAGVGAASPTDPL